MAQVTLSDIARHAGVSLPVVAKVLLNNRSTVRVGKERAELIRRTAEEMGYRPNTLAQALRSGKSHILGMLTGGLASPYFSESLECSARLAEQAGYQLLTIPVQWGRETEQKAVDTLLGKQVDGILVATDLFSEYSESFARYRDVPIVPFPGVAEIRLDFLQGMREFFSLFPANGISRIAYLTNPDVPEKEQAYLTCCREFSIPPEVIRFESFPESTFDKLADEPAKLPPQLLVCSDFYAMRLISLLGRRGARIPQDFQIAAIGGTRAGRYFHPTLASVDQKISEVCTLRMRLLLDRIQGRSEPQCTVVHTTFQEGGSFPLPWRE